MVRQKLSALRSSTGASGRSFKSVAGDRLGVLPLGSMARPDRHTTELLLGGLYEEYRALYGLVVFRMTSLDRRAPVTAGALIAAVSAVAVLPAASQPLVLFSLPIALIWFVRTTVNHARSFEDVLRRIEEIELDVNAAVGGRVMRFQSSHPSRGRKTGGRTGAVTVSAVIATSLLLLIAVGYQMCQQELLPVAGEALYGMFLSGVGLWCLREATILRRYRYVPTPDLTN